MSRAPLFLPIAGDINLGYVPSVPGFPSPDSVSTIFVIPTGASLEESAVTCCANTPVGKLRAGSVREGSANTQTGEGAGMMV